MLNYINYYFYFNNINIIKHYLKFNNIVVVCNIMSKKVIPNFFTLEHVFGIIGRGQVRLISYKY